MCCVVCCVVVVVVVAASARASPFLFHLHEQRPMTMGLFFMRNRHSEKKRQCALGYSTRYMHAVTRTSDRNRPATMGLFFLPGEKTRQCALDGVYYKDEELVMKSWDELGRVGRGDDYG